MSEPRPRYPMSMHELRQRCPLLASVDVAPDSLGSGIMGKNAAGEIVIHAKGKITPKLVTVFRESYQHAVHVGIIKGEKTSA